MKICDHSTKTSKKYATLQKGVKQTERNGMHGNQGIVDKYYAQIEGKNEVYQYVLHNCQVNRVTKGLDVISHILNLIMLITFILVSLI